MEATMAMAIGRSGPGKDLNVCADAVIKALT
jgi:hypothetical protein